MDWNERRMDILQNIDSLNLGYSLKVNVMQEDGQNVMQITRSDGGFILQDHCADIASFMDMYSFQLTPKSFGFSRRNNPKWLNFKYVPQQRTGGDYTTLDDPDGKRAPMDLKFAYKGIRKNRK